MIEKLLNKLLFHNLSDVETICIIHIIQKYTRTRFVYYVRVRSTT